ncbi:MAG: GNAT family N-acetyltransferase [Acetatifactor sp.]|nr:GNAT family N-acetyltransferase [Acetatifactor sp.]
MEEQKLIIRPLSSELCEDWLHYFDKTAFQDHEDWAFCYCLEGHLDRKTNEQWTDPKERREKAIELIRTGEMQGYLAYLGDKVVGWCNVNDRKNYRYLTEMFREIGYQTEEAADTKVKVIFCFLIAPGYRGKGIAQSLLDRVCEDAAKDGYAYIEVYPFADEKFEFPYHGTSKMYERNGFAEAANLKYVKVMRKML